MKIALHFWLSKPIDSWPAVRCKNPRDETSPAWGMKSSANPGNEGAMAGDN
ncbi:hypothetical protein ACOJBM_12295 [Rhizobium beringeri]